MNHQHTNNEDTITTLFVEILMPMSATWNIYEQTTKPLVENQRRPDVLIRTIERYPIAVEVKIDDKRGPNETGEKQAREHYLPMFCPIGPPFHIVGKVLCKQWRRVLS